jgi:formylglycine-generating enzyme required for sulfatase activity
LGASEFDAVSKRLSAIRDVLRSANIGGAAERISKRVDLIQSSSEEKNRDARYSSPLERLGVELIGGKNRSSSEIRHIATGIQLAEVSSGFFDMGSMHGDADERPVHRVHITRPFWISRTPVTQAQYKALVGRNPSHFCAGGEAPSRPVEMVSWNDAVAFCAAMTKVSCVIDRVHYGFRLPTEAEWEYCCRAGSNTEWHTGSTLTSAHANFDERLKGTSAVGRFSANAWGLFDMHGNVWEWCLDSKSNYAGASVSDPLVLAGVDRVYADRVYRGGSWINNAASCRSAFRNSAGPAGRYSVVGFRVVLAPVVAV